MHRELAQPKGFLASLFALKGTIKREMGRIRTRLIKRTANEFIVKHKSEFTDNFDHNKLKVAEFADVSTKKLRNKIAGYITKLVKIGLD